MAQLAQLDDIKLRLSVEVGRTELTIREVLDLKEGSVVELDRLAGDPLDIFANGTMIARGEVVVAGERFGIRFSQVVDPAERTPED
ncbi:flagellar motor switch protein FliN [Rhodosalinus sediminis]